MTEPGVTWADARLGAMPGLGNARPRGGAEIKSELDVGLAVVRYLYDNSRIDAEWSVHEERGFRWWADGLAQRVWSEPALDDDGTEIFRVFAATELLRRVADVTGAAHVIDTINGLSAGSAIVLDPDAQTIGSVASMWVHAGSRDWVARAFSVIAAIQVAQAQQQATMLAPLVEGEPAFSAHPDSGPRTEPDQMLGLLDIVKADGAARTRWAGADLVGALRQLRELPIVVLATGDEAGLAIEVTYRQTTALIRVDTDEPHPGLGNGMIVRLSLPGAAGPGPGWAAMRNRQELKSLTRAHFVGSWVGSAAFATFVSFYPNMLARTGIGAVNVALSTINRAMWIAGEGRTSAARAARDA
ncbi:MAG TPA: hypothetical protein VK987_06260 [Anaerolineae bacterium]|nr:hypothetical protein [Anaerolineae bacterium]